MRLVSEWELNSGYAKEPVEAVQSYQEDHPVRQELFHQDVFKQLDAIVYECTKRTQFQAFCGISHKTAALCCHAGQIQLRKMAPSSDT